MMANKIRVLMTLWGKVGQAFLPALPGTDGKVCPHLNAEEQRHLRLEFLSGIVGREIESAKELTERELDRCIDILRHEATAWRPLRSPGDAERAKPSREQLFKIRLLEQELCWTGVPERLAGFLHAKYHCRRVEDLTRVQAGLAIESLFAVLARTRIKTLKGDAYAVGMNELRCEIKYLKRHVPKYFQGPEEARPQITQISRGY